MVIENDWLRSRQRQLLSRICRRLRQHLFPEKNAHDHFNIPSLVPLVPGGPAYKAVREFALGDNFVGFENLMIVVITAGAIAGGFMMTSVVEKIVNRWQMKRTKNIPQIKKSPETIGAQKL